MKTMRFLILCFTVSFLPACANLGIPDATTFNQKLAVGYATVTAVRDTATKLVTAQRISVKDAQNVLEQTDNARTGLDVARSMYREGQKISADNKLESINVALRALQTYLAGHQ